MAGHGTVLVVDDNTEVCASLEEMLQDEGFDVKTSRNGREALDLLLGGLRPCAILLDLMMPVMHGWDFRAEQMRTPELAAIPVAVISASGFTTKSMLAQLGDVEFFPKPVSASEILAFMKRH
jgi:CheY-like chemotaxis protein